jgi:hypothetical protein
MGKLIPDRIHNEPVVWRQGLKLRQGPDPRSYNAALAVATDVRPGHVECVEYLTRR